MDQKIIKVKGLLLTGPEMYIIPGLAIVGAAGIVTAAGYGIYKIFTNVIKTKKETNELIESMDEFGKYVDTLKKKEP